jgi:anti-anti-sigma factor
LVNEEQAARIELAGDLDLYRRDEIAALFPPPEHTGRVIIDMRKATMIDSTVIATLMRYRRAFVDAGNDAHDIVLIVPPQFRRVFEITGLVRLLTIITGEPGRELSET